MHLAQIHKIIEAINRQFDKAIVVTDVGQHQMWTTQFLELNEYQPVYEMLRSHGKYLRRRQQEITDVSPCAASLTVRNREDLGRIIKEAFYIARTGRPGPVVIDLPKDVMGELGSHMRQRHGPMPARAAAK